MWRLPAWPVVEWSLPMRVGMIGTGAISREARAGIPENRLPADGLHRHQRGRRPAVRRAARRGVRPHLRGGLPPSPGGLRGRVHLPRFPPPAASKSAPQTGKHVQVQKPIATNLETARRMVETARARRHSAGSGEPAPFRRRQPVPFQSHRRRPPRQTAQCDCYVKWYRSPEYYARPIKGSWQTEGGGALINQAIHQIDILRWLAGPVRGCSRYGSWARSTKSNPKTW